MKYFQIFAIFLILIPSAGSADFDENSDQRNVDCFGDMRQILIDGGYSGVTDCADMDIQLNKVGDIKIDEKKYQIYDFRYRTIPIFEGGVRHGGQKIFVFLNNKEYVGSYILNTSVFRHISIGGMSVFLDISKSVGNEIVIDKNGPQKEVRIDEDYIHLEK
jgi:hypothetical protein